MTDQLIDNAAWLAGYAAYERGEGIPWGDGAGRAGWLAGRDDTESPVERAARHGMRDGVDAARQWLADFGDPSDPVTAKRRTAAREHRGDPGFGWPEPDLTGWGFGYPSGDGGWITSTDPDTDAKMRAAYVAAFLAAVDEVERSTPYPSAL